MQPNNQSKADVCRWAVVRNNNFFTDWMIDDVMDSSRHHLSIESITASSNNEKSNVRVVSS